MVIQLHAEDQPKNELGMTHTDLIIKLIESRNYDSFMEIGVRNPAKNINLVPARRKVGVDPYNWNDKTTELSDGKYHRGLDGYDCEFYQMQSEFFYGINNEKFDVILVDGLHHASAVLWDCINCMDRLNVGGVLVVHDINPPSKESQVIPRGTKEWTGDGWKAWAVLIDYLGTMVPWLTFKYGVIREDFGIGVIELLDKTEERIIPDFETFTDHKIRYWRTPPYNSISDYLG